jgi:hypothetical protein
LVLQHDHRKSHSRRICSYGERRVRAGLHKNKVWWGNEQ